MNIFFLIQPIISLSGSFRVIYPMNGVAEVHHRLAKKVECILDVAEAFMVPVLLYSLFPFFF